MERRTQTGLRQKPFIFPKSPRRRDFAERIFKKMNFPPDSASGTGTTIAPSDDRPENFRFSGKQDRERRAKKKNDKIIVVFWSLKKRFWEHGTIRPFIVPFVQAPGRVIHSRGRIFAPAV